MSALEARVSWADEVTEPAAHLDTELVERLQKLIGRREPKHGPESLTPREWQVLALVAEGANNATVGRLLYLSSHTATSHVRHIIEKLGAHNRAHAVAIGAAHMRDRDKVA